MTTCSHLLTKTQYPCHYPILPASSLARNYPTIVDEFFQERLLITYGKPSTPQSFVEKPSQVAGHAHFLVRHKRNNNPDNPEIKHSCNSHNAECRRLSYQ
ncbi:MAG: hypothetical protein KG029_20160 [Bacteroidetes bacterium]|nr:hypothetical protein [Bacteroidota bacterium]